MLCYYIVDEIQRLTIINNNKRLNEQNITEAKVVWSLPRPLPRGNSSDIFSLLSPEEHLHVTQTVFLPRGKTSMNFFRYPGVRICM